jgi:hypothetical protein
MDFKALVPWKSDAKARTPAARDTVLDPFLAFRQEVDRMFDGSSKGSVGPRDRR